MEISTSKRSELPDDEFLRRWSDARRDFCVRMCHKAKKYFDQGDGGPEKIRKYMEVDFKFYGGHKLFGEHEYDSVIDGACAYALRDCELPE